LQAGGYSIDSLLKGEDLMSFHYMKEEVFDIFLKVLEKIGYSQEKNNKEPTLRNFTHDITHAIYGSSSNYFVTEDQRFGKKLKAIFHFLEIPCEVIGANELLEISV